MLNLVLHAALHGAPNFWDEVMTPAVLSEAVMTEDEQ